MEAKEACLIVAKFDGWKRVALGGGEGIWYLKVAETLRIGGLIEKYLSLDALVPVWEKLGDTSFCLYTIGVGFFKCETPFSRVTEADTETIQEAAAIATAIAIQELK